MNIAIIDVDLIERKRHRFPNLACMKISGYHKSIGNTTVLKMDYFELEKFDKVYISKVFTDTIYPEFILSLPNVEYGGTGFYFDKAPNLDEAIEHSFPDYDLYSDFINRQISLGVKQSEFKEYLDCSIGFLTRGCFRKCKFCVNQKYDRVFCHSPLKEFYDPNRKRICLLDDNFLGQSNWKLMLQGLIDTGKPFKFKQGLDERILTDEKCEMLFNAKYDGEIVFAFDDIDDYDLIKSKLKLIRKHTHKICKFYVLCGFDKLGNYDNEFWKLDIINAFKRIELLMRFQCIPYIMRFNKYNQSPYKGIYILLARWCNQVSFFKKKSIIEFAELDSSAATTKYINQLKEILDDDLINIKYSNYE